MDQVLKVQDFCDVFEISRSTWQVWKRQGRTPTVVTVGGIQRITRGALEEWISENESRHAADAAHQAAEQAAPMEFSR